LQWSSCAYHLGLGDELPPILPVEPGSITGQMASSAAERPLTMATTNDGYGAATALNDVSHHGPLCSSLAKRAAVDAHDSIPP
jgi:hypothetical protein